MNNPILSICIPTYNRVNYLKETILSIVNQDRFKDTNDVEIVISDNHYNDDTFKMISDFIKIYGEKIRYYKNENFILHGFNGEDNLEKVLSYGKGTFLKLNNDTLKHVDGSLDRMIDTIQDNRLEKNILYFLNGALKIKSQICNNLDSFVKQTSFYTTWIATFGIWKEDFIKLNNFSKCVPLQLPQTDVLFRLIQDNRKVFIDNNKLFDSIHPSTKGGYDLLTVFLDNYIFLLTEQLNNKKITKKTFVNEKRRLLIHFIRPMLVHMKISPQKYYFESKNKWKQIFKYYKEDFLILLFFVVSYYMSIPYIYLKIWNIKIWITDKLKDFIEIISSFPKMILFIKDDEKYLKKWFI